MLFNSLSSAIFLPLVFAIYWLIGGCGRRWNADPTTRRAETLRVFAAHFAKIG